MSPQLVDHPHTDSCIVIGCTRCSLAEKRTRLFLVAVTSQLSYSRSEQLNSAFTSPLRSPVDLLTGLVAEQLYCAAVYCAGMSSSRHNASVSVWCLSVCPSAIVGHIL